MKSRKNQIINQTTSFNDNHRMLQTAWEQVDEACIANTWSKAGFCQNRVKYEDQQGPPEGIDEESFTAYVKCDNSLQCHGSLSTSEIVQLFKEKGNTHLETEDVNNLEDIPAPQIVQVILYQ